MYISQFSICTCSNLQLDEWVRDQFGISLCGLYGIKAFMELKENPRALLVGMQTGAATVESSVEFPQKIKNGTAF